MAQNLYGTPHQNYVARGNTVYPADGNGLIANVASADAEDLIAQGCIDQAQWLRVRAANGLTVSDGVTSVANVTEIDVTGATVANTGGGKAGVTVTQQTRTENRFYFTPVAPAAASAGLLFNSAALSNGTLAVAANVDVMRQAQAIIIPGASAITAGNLALTYDANDGTAAQVDNLSLITPLSTTLTVSASKGILRMRSQIVTGLTGGTSPTIQIGTTAALAVPVPAAPQSLAIVSEFLDAGVVSVANAGSLSTSPLGIYTPHTAPNATHNFGVGYTAVA